MYVENVESEALKSTPFILFIYEHLLKYWSDDLQWWILLRVTTLLLTSFLRRC